MLHAIAITAGLALFGTAAWWAKSQLKKVDASLAVFDRAHLRDDIDDELAAAIRGD